jgi:hypothetical protein
VSRFAFRHAAAERGLLAEDARTRPKDPPCGIRIARPIGWHFRTPRAQPLADVAFGLGQVLIVNRRWPPSGLSSSRAEPGCAIASADRLSQNRSSVGENGVARESSMNRIWAGVVWFVAATGSGRNAAADVVGPPPTDCVPGTRPQTSHSGAYCGPSICNSGSDCPAGVPCRPVGFCQVGIGVRGYCDGSGRCAAGTCSTFQVCIAGAGGTSATGGSSGRGGGALATSGRGLAGHAGTAGNGLAGTGDEWLTGRACTCRTPARDRSSGGLIAAVTVGLGSVLARCRRRRHRT